MSDEEETKPDLIPKFAAAYVAAQGEIEGAVKGSTNPHFKSKYADLSAVIDAIRPALSKHGLAFIQDVTEGDSGIYIQTVILHTSGEMYRTGKLFMPAPKQDPHGYGSAITYAKRYQLQATFGVPSEDDDGNKAAEATTKKTHFPRPVDSAMEGETFTKEQTERLNRIASALTDLTDEEGGADENGELINNEYKIWELCEPIVEQGEKLYLSAQLGSRARARIKVIAAKKRAEANPQESTGLKTYTTRGRTNAIPTT
jgi:hypothetical protein